MQKEQVSLEGVFLKNIFSHDKNEAQSPKRQIPVACSHERKKKWSFGNQYLEHSEYDLNTKTFSGTSLSSCVIVCFAFQRTIQDTELDLCIPLTKLEKQLLSLPDLQCLTPESLLGVNRTLTVNPVSSKPLSSLFVASLNARIIEASLQWIH